MKMKKCLRYTRITRREIHSEFCTANEVVNHEKRQNYVWGIDTIMGWCYSNGRKEHAYCTKTENYSLLKSEQNVSLRNANSCANIKVKFT